MTDTPHAGPDDPRDPRLPRRQRLVLREGDPPRRRPRLARGVPDQHAPRLHRPPAPDAARAARALLLPRPPRRVRRAAERGHLARPRRRARRAGAAAGGRPRHPPRQDPRVKGRPGDYNVIFGYVDEQVGLAAGRLAVRLVNHLVEARPGLRLGRRARGVHQARRAHGVRAVDPGDRRRGRLARHPVDPAQPALAGPARPGRPRQADPGHDDVGDRLDRRRHRLRQGPDHPAARRGRPAGAQAGVGAHRRPGRLAWPNRIGYPVVRQAARRQPRPRACASTCRTRPTVREAFPIAEEQSRRGWVIVESLRHRQGLPLPDHRRPDGRDRRAGAGPRRRRRHLDRRGAGRAHQRRPAPRRRPREGADPDQGRRGRRARCSPSRATRSTSVPERARWSSWRSPATCRPAASRSTAPSRRTRRTSRSPRRRPGWSGSTSPASTSSAPTSPSRSARPAARSAR